MNVLPTIDEHHGLQCDSDLDAEIALRGIGITSDLQSAFERMGLPNLQEFDGGFSATRRTTEE